MSPNEYATLAMETEADQEVIRQRVYDGGIQATRLNNAARGLADDCGELNGAVKKFLEYGQPLDRTNVIEELGDILWRVAQACKAIDCNLDEVMAANIRKLHKVRYPAGVFDSAKAIDRDLNAERSAVESKWTNDDGKANVCPKCGACVPTEGYRKGKCWHCDPTVLTAPSVSDQQSKSE